MAIDACALAREAHLLRKNWAASLAMTTPIPVQPVDERDHCRGASQAAVTIIEYGDYDCPHTRAAQSVVDRLAAEHPDVRVVFRPFPLRHIHNNAEILARVAEAAELQGKFWPMHDHLMRHGAALDDRSLLADVEDAGVDLARLRGDVENGAVIANIERHVQHGRESGVHSTPTFFFNGDKHDGHYDYETLAARLSAARALA